MQTMRTMHTMNTTRRRTDKPRPMPSPACAGLVQVRRPTRLSVLLALVTLMVTTAGCTFGLHQAIFAPSIAGSRTFSGSSWSVTGQSGSGESFAFQTNLDAVSANDGDISTLPRAAIGLDLPRLRLTVGPYLSENPAWTCWVGDAWYKHPLPSRGRVQLRALVGLGYSLLDTGVQQVGTVTIDKPTSIDGAWLRQGDEVQYTALAKVDGFFAGVGIEAQLLDWLYVFATGQAQLNRSRSRSDSLVLSVADGGNADGSAQTFDLMGDPRFAAQQTTVGSVQSDANLPAVTVVLGVGFDFPNARQMRRVFHRPGGKRDGFGERNRRKPLDRPPAVDYSPSARPPQEAPAAPEVPTGSFPPPAEPVPGS